MDLVCCLEAPPRRLPADYVDCSGDVLQLSGFDSSFPSHLGPQPMSSSLVARPGPGDVGFALQQTPPWPLVKSCRLSAPRYHPPIVPPHGLACLLRQGPRVQLLELTSGRFRRWVRTSDPRPPFQVQQPGIEKYYLSPEPPVPLTFICNFIFV